MRQGKLLAEDSPEKLLSTFHTNSLEEVFLMLSRKQTEERLYEIQSESMLEDLNHTSSTVSMVMSDLNSSKDVSILYCINKYSSLLV